MKKILKSWLIQQSRLIPGSRHAALFTGVPDEGPYNQTLCWPEENIKLTSIKHIADASTRSKQPVIKTRYNTNTETGEPFDCLAVPLFIEGRLIGAYAIEMTNRPQAMQQIAIQLIQAGTKWLETMISLHNSTEKEQLINLVELIATGLDSTSFKSAITDVANELSQRFECQRVSIGFSRFHRVQLDAISQTANIDRQSNLSRALADAMNEAADQASTIVFPCPDEQSPLSTRMHAELSQQLKGPAICTVPLVNAGRISGAMVLERSIDDPFTPETILQCEQIGLLLGPIMESRKENEQPLIFKVFNSLRTTLGKLFGPAHLAFKSCVLLCALLAGWLVFDTSTLRITSNAALEAGTCRAVIAPQQGYIATATVRAGDLVSEGELMATLDDRELRQEQRKWISQRTQLLKEYRKALAVSDRSQVAILNAKRAQAEAQIALIEQQLERTDLTAPVSGMVITGDLNQSIGSPVERGEILFEVAPTGEYRVVINVDDLDIGLVKPGQRGQLKLSGLPDQKIDLTIDRLTPLATSESGRNFFRVEALMDKQSDLMRPGMEGIAKVEIGEKNLLTIWTRRLVQWWRLFAWNHLP